MRHARSYSIVDHELLHGGHLARLSHLALALYLFLVVVGDRDGRSFYSERTICGILRLSPPELAIARAELVTARLVDYCAPYWRVMSLSIPAIASRASATKHKPAHCASSDLVSVRGIVPEGLRELRRSLEGGPR